MDYFPNGYSLHNMFLRGVIFLKFELRVDTHPLYYINTHTHTHTYTSGTKRYTFETSRQVLTSND